MTVCAVVTVRTPASEAAGSDNDRNHPAGQRGRHQTRACSRCTPWWLAALLATVYSAVALDRHNRFQTSGFDLGIFDQIISSYARLAVPESSIKALTDGYGQHFNMLGDHFHPLLATLAPVYWVWPDPRALLVVQAVLVGLSSVPVWRFTQRRLGAVSASAITLGYGFSFGIQGLVGFDFHEVALAVPLIAWAVELADRQRWSVAFVLILALPLVKEDLGLTVSAFGLFALLRGRQVIAAWLMSAGLACFLATTMWLMPALGDHAYAYWSYQSLGPDVRSASWHLLRHPVDSLRLAFSPWEKVRTLGELFVQTGFLSLASPVLVLLLPQLAERAFSDRAAMWLEHDHYSAVSAPLLFLAAADGLARFCKMVTVDRRRLLAVGLSLTILVGTFMTSMRAGLAVSEPFDSYARQQSSERAAELDKALALLPPDGSVEAGGWLVPHLLHRAGTLRLSSGESWNTEWIVLEPSVPQWPLSLTQVRDRLAAAGQEGYVQVYASPRVVVLKRSS